MKKNTLLLITLFLIVIGCEKNQAPQINTIESLTDIIVGGSEVILKVNSADENGDVLTYTWSASSGEFISNVTSDSVVWKAPLSIINNSYTITATVSDGEFTVADELIVSVEGGKVIDLRDDKIYEFVQIGDQVWLVENMAYLPALTPSDNGSDDDPCYYVYGDEGTNLSEAMETDNYYKYGALYNWKAAMTACLNGWNLPSENDWKMLEEHLGMNSEELDEYGWRTSGDVGRKLKSTSEWHYAGNGTNSSGFNSLPGGVRLAGQFGGTFNYLELQAYFWSSSVAGSSSYILGRYLDYEFSGVYRYSYYRSSGFSVRCILGQTIQ